MLRLWLVAAFIQCISCSCPSGFILQFNGICTEWMYNGASHLYEYVSSDAITFCKSHPPSTTIILHSQEEEDNWIQLIKTTTFRWVSKFLQRIIKYIENRHINMCYSSGIQCNPMNGNWEWSDGSAIDYKPRIYDTKLDAKCTDNTGWFMYTDNTWYASTSTNPSNFSTYCMAPLPARIPSDNECGDFSSEDGACFQVGGTAETFVDAQSVCKSFGGNLASIHNAEEDKFVRRLAVSRGQVNGMFLGATISGKSPDFSWIDGSTWNYTNFMPGFPVDLMGDCIAMDTNDVNRHWVNVDCAQKIPFACARRAGDVEPSCGNTAYEEGEVIYSPGFPNDASIPCDYFLMVISGKHVEVEIYMLEANTLYDHLVLTEGSIGGTVIANLTGEIKSGGTKYRTKSSNMMRVSWQPNGGVNVRGAMFTYRAV